jgi:predicted RNA binding protein YcfA (HicA-like mRNA interferase family)
MKTYNRREVERIILKNGWELDHCTGGHTIYKKEGAKKTLSIAYKKCNRMVVQRLIKEFELVT